MSENQRTSTPGTPLAGPRRAEVGLQVGNTYTTLLGASDALLGVLSRILSYPTQTALRTPQEGDPSRSGGWDGWIRLLKTFKHLPPRFPTGLLPLVQKVLQSYGIEGAIQDTRKRPEPGVPELRDLQLRPYQKAAVEAAETVGRGVIDMPPRSGKTRIGIELVRRLALPAVWIAPTDGIVEQTVASFDKLLGKNYAQKVVGSSWTDARHAPAVVCTNATANMLPPEFYKTREVLLVDEFHHSAAKSSRYGIFAKCDHIYYRYGMTGTFFRSGYDDMAMHAHLSNVLFSISSKDLLQGGILVPTSVFYVPPATPRLRGVPDGFITGHGKFGLHENDARNALVCRIAHHLYRHGRHVLVLVGTKEHGERVRRGIMEQLGLEGKRAGTEFNTCEFVNSGVARPVIGRVLKSFQDGAEVRILVGTSLIGEGIDLPRADALVYARGEHAEVTLRQYSYRVSTAFEGKQRAILVDFADRHHRKLLEHAKDRLRMFFEEPTCDVTIATDERDLYARMAPLFESRC